NLETPHGKVVQIVLAAQPGIMETMQLPELASFNQRLTVRANVEPLEVAEAVDFVAHHLRLAGGRPEALIADDAMELLARGTGGVRRLLGQATHQALQLAGTAETAIVDAEAVLEALSRLGLEPQFEAEEPAAVLAASAPTTETTQAGLFPADGEH